MPSVNNTGCVSRPHRKGPCSRSALRSSEDSTSAKEHHRCFRKASQRRLFPEKVRSSSKSAACHAKSKDIVDRADRPGIPISNVGQSLTAQSCIRTVDCAGLISRGEFFVGDVENG